MFSYYHCLDLLAAFFSLSIQFENGTRINCITYMKMRDEMWRVRV